MLILKPQDLFETTGIVRKFTVAYRQIKSHASLKNLILKKSKAYCQYYVQYIQHNEGGFVT